MMIHQPFINCFPVAFLNDSFPVDRHFFLFFIIRVREASDAPKHNHRHNELMLMKCDQHNLQANSNQVTLLEPNQFCCNKTRPANR